MAGAVHFLFGLEDTVLEASRKPGSARQYGWEMEDTAVL